MRNLHILFSFGIACALAQPLLCSAAENFLSSLSRSYPEIKWEKSSVVTADFNGDKIIDRAVIGYKDGQAIVSISMGHDKNHSKTQLLPFGVGAGIQAAICEVPATLKTEPLECTAEDSPLPGCKRLSAAKGLSLSGGKCDSIHLYWNHLTKQMEWWRL